jgi:flagellar motor switch protein FliM
MPDVLSQSEVDALLAAVEAPGAAGESADGRESLGRYDFARPERASREQLRALESMHELLSRNLAAALSGMLRASVDVQLSAVDQLTYSEFVASLPSPTCFSIVTAEPLEGRMVIEMNPAIVYAMLDKMLGGPATNVVIDRPMTEIERNLAERIMSQVLTLMREAWRPIKEIHFRLHDVESNPQLVQIAPPTEAVVLVIFDVRMGDAAGLLNVCIPYKVIEPVMGAFTTIQSWFASERREQRPEERGAIAVALSGVPLELAVEVASAGMTVEDLTSLRPGDVITTERKQGSPFLLKIGGRPKYLGQPGRRGNRKSFLIEGRSSPEERI